MSCFAAPISVCGADDISPWVMFPSLSSKKCYRVQTNDDNQVLNRHEASSVCQQVCSRRLFVNDNLYIVSYGNITTHTSYSMLRASGVTQSSDSEKYIR